MRKKKTSNAARDVGAFPSPFDASNAFSRESCRVRASQSNEDVYPPMCGQATLNKILAVGSPIRGAKSDVERASLLPAQNQKNRTHEQLAYDISQMHSLDTLSQTNVVKVKEARAKKSRSRVREASTENIKVHSMHETKEDSSSMSSISLNTDKQSPPSPQARFPHKTKETSSNNDNVSLLENDMIRSMQDIIMQQHNFIYQLGMENRKYRGNMVLFQEQITSLENEKAFLQEEMETMRLQLLVKTFSERGGQEREQSLPPASFIRFDSNLPSKQKSVANSTDLQELRARGIELYECVSKFKLEEPMSTRDFGEKRGGNDEEEKYSSNSATWSRQREVGPGIRFSREKNG